MWAFLLRKCLKIDIIILHYYYIELFHLYKYNVSLINNLKSNLEMHRPGPIQSIPHCIIIFIVLKKLVKGQGYRHKIVASTLPLPMQACTYIAACVHACILICYQLKSTWIHLLATTKFLGDHTPPRPPNRAPKW